MFGVVKKGCSTLIPGASEAWLRSAFDSDQELMKPAETPPTGDHALLL